MKSVYREKRIKERSLEGKKKNKEGIGKVEDSVTILSLDVGKWWWFYRNRD